MRKRGQLALTSAAGPLSLVVAGISAPSCSQTAAEPLNRDSAKSESGCNLARQNQNPVGDFISLSLRNKVNFGYGPRGGTQNLLQAQPVVRFQVSDDWNASDDWNVSGDWNLIPEGSRRSSGSGTPRQFRPRRSHGADIFRRMPDAVPWPKSIPSKPGGAYG